MHIHQCPRKIETWAFNTFTFILFNFRSKYGFFKIYITNLICVINKSAKKIHMYVLTKIINKRHLTVLTQNTKSFFLWLYFIFANINDSQ